MTATDLIETLNTLPPEDRLAVPLVAFVMAGVDSDMSKEQLLKLVGDMADSYARTVADEKAVAS